MLVCSNTSIRRVMFSILLIYLIVLTRYMVKPGVIEETKDTIELLKCEIEALKSRYKEVKDENEQLTIRLDHVEKQNIRQNHSIVEVEKKSSKLSTYCRMLPQNTCGQCTCLDDYNDASKYYCDCQHLQAKRDCLEHYEDGNRISGVYTVHMNHLKQMQVFCDQENDNGGWIVFQKRVDASTNFYQNWFAYKKGFGNPHRNFWLGLDNLYIATIQSIYPKGSELRVDMEDWEGNHVYAKYSKFKVDGESANYTLHVSGYSGNSGDSLSYHSKRQFSTYDRNHDDNWRCSRLVRGAWWYGHCYSSNLNGEYRWIDDEQPGSYRGITWVAFRANTYSLKYVDMKLRRIK